LKVFCFLECVVIYIVCFPNFLGKLIILTGEISFFFTDDFARRFGRIAIPRPSSQKVRAVVKESSSIFSFFLKLDSETYIFNDLLCSSNADGTKIRGELSIFPTFLLDELIFA
jgi:hypothetical protein